MLRRLSTEPTKLPADAQERALTAYSTSKQVAQALVSYFKDFARVQNMMDVGLPELCEETLALTFLKRLTSHYSPLLVSIMKHQRPVTKSVKEAYEMALEFYVNPRITGDLSSTTDATSAVSRAVTLRSGRGGGGWCSAGGGRGDSVASKASEGPGLSPATDEAKGGGSTVTPVKLRKCFFRREPGHLVKDCPKKAAAKEERATTLVVVSSMLQSAYAMSVSTDRVAGFTHSSSKYLTYLNCSQDVGDLRLKHHVYSTFHIRELNSPIQRP